MRRMHTLALLIMMPLAAVATEADRLVAALASGNESAMAEARQLLPRQPIEAVRGIVPLVDHEDRRIAAAAMRTLEDFISVVSVPGREDDRRAVTRHIMTLVVPDASDRARDAGLRLIPLAAPEGYDLGPVAAWLSHPDAREAARASLELSGTRPARDALRAALNHADAGFQSALLNALAQFDDPRSISVAASLLQSPEPEVRAAATRVLARSGGIDEAGLIRHAMRQLDGDHRREAAESYAVLAERILLSGGNWDRGIAMFLELLETSPDNVAKGIALAGLGRFGDERAVPVILSALGADGGEALERQAVSALQDLDGPAVREKLLAAHESLSPSMQVRMLDVYARKHDRRFLDILLDGVREARGQEAQRVAIGALATSRFPEAVDALAAFTATGDEDFDYEVLRVLERTAGNMEALGHAEAAGRAYLAVYRQTDLPVVRQFALAGIMRNPVPEAYEVLLAEIDAGDITGLPVDLLAGLTRALYDQGRTEEAADTLDALLARATAPHEVNALIETLHDAPIEGGLRDRLGLITRWQLVGPFDWNMEDAFTVTHINEPDIDLEATYTGKNGDEIRWETIESHSGHGFVELTGILGQHEYCSAYAFATVTVNEETGGQVRVGSDDGIKLWVNREAVLERNVDRGMALDQDSAPITLREGENEILVQITQNAAGWGFVLRLVDENGAPLSTTGK